MEITIEEINAIRAYQGIGHQLINNILEEKMSAEEDFIRKPTDKPIEFSRQDIEELIKNVRLIYSAMVKYSKDNPSLKRVYRGTSQSDVDRITARKGINKFLSATYDQEMAKGYFSLNWDKPVFMGIDVEVDTPYLDMAEVLDDYGENWEREVVLSPFLNIKKIEHTDSVNKSTAKGNKIQNVYKVEARKKELLQLSEEDREDIGKEVLNSAEEISDKQKRYFQISREIEESRYFINANTEKLKEMRDALTNCNSDKEKRYLNEDITFLESEEIPRLERSIEELNLEKENISKDVEGWKKKIVQICMSDCREVELDVEHQMAQEKQEAQRRFEEEKIKKEQEMILRTQRMHSSTCDGIKSKVNSVDRSAQFALNFRDETNKIAKYMGVSYTSYIEVLRNLPNCINGFYDKLDNFSEAGSFMSNNKDEDFEILKMKSTHINGVCNTLLKVCSTIGDIPVRELMNLEDNAFKQGMYNKVLGVKLGIYEDELRKAIENIDSVKGAKKLIYKLIGQEKRNEQRKEQLNNGLRQILIQKKEIVSGLYNMPEKQSVHEILAEIQTLEYEYSGKPEFKREMEELKRVREGIDMAKYGYNQEKVDRLTGNKIDTKMLAVKGKKYSRTDAIIQEVNDFNRIKVEKKPPVRWFEAENSIQLMSNIMRDAMLGNDRIKEISKDIDR